MMWELADEFFKGVLDEGEILLIRVGQAKTLGDDQILQILDLFFVRIAGCLQHDLVEDFVFQIFSVISFYPPRLRACLRFR